MKNNMMLVFGMVIVLSLHTSMCALGILSPLRWLKQKFTRQPTITRTISEQEPHSRNVSVNYDEHSAVIVKKDVLFENNIPDFFEALAEDPQYKDLPNLVDQSVIVNGICVKPGSCETIAVHNNQFMITIKLYKGIAKLIYSMEQGTMRGILLRLLNHIEPWIQWQYNLTCNINKDVNCVELADIILQAYAQALDGNAVNHRFKWVLVVELSLNKELNI